MRKVNISNRKFDQLRFLTLGICIALLGILSLKESLNTKEFPLSIAFIIIGMGFSATTIGAMVDNVLRKRNKK